MFGVHKKICNAAKSHVSEDNLDPILNPEEHLNHKNLNLSTWGFVLFHLKESTVWEFSEVSGGTVSGRKFFVLFFT